MIDLHEAKSIEPLLNVTNPDLKFLYSPSTKIGSP
jgi:hypothetical protein